MAQRTGKGALVALLAAGSITFGALPAFGAPVSATFARTWDPTPVHLTKGKRVVWKNPSGEAHNIRAYGGNWSFRESLGFGDSVARRFKRVGTFKYLCKLHGSTQRVDGKLVCTGMCGKVKVHR